MVQSNFCNTDLSGVEKPAATLTQFVDYIFGENADRWQAHETLHQHRRAQRCLGFILRCQTGQQSSEGQAGRRGGRGGNRRARTTKRVSSGSTISSTTFAECTLSENASNPQEPVPQKLAFRLGTFATFARIALSLPMFVGKTTRAL